MREHFFDKRLLVGLASYTKTGVTCAIECVSSFEMPVFQEEIALVSQASIKRKNEFVAGRISAHAALSKIGIKMLPILARSDRSPIWPIGVCGSISHTNTLAMAVVSPISVIQSVGADLEVATVLNHNLRKAIFLPEELASLDLWSENLGMDVGKLIFSAKEAFFKSYYPVTGAFLNFRDVRIEIWPKLGKFTATMANLEKPDPTNDGLIGNGYFFLASGHVFTLHLLIPA